MLYSGAKDTWTSNQVEKMQKKKKIKNIFFDLLPTYRGFGATYQKSPCQISGLYDDPFGL